MQVAVADLCLGDVFDVTTCAGFLQLGMATSNPPSKPRKQVSKTDVLGVS